MRESPNSDITAIVARARLGPPSGEDIIAAIKQPCISDLSPWELWSLVGFVRHERRQKWVGLIVESKRKGSGSELGSFGAFGHPQEMEQEGEVPDTPGWRYYFHGRGCCLHHVDGTCIDVDFAEDGSAEEIDPYFYSRFLATAPNPDWSDARIRTASPLEEAWQFDLRRLAELGLIEKKWRFRVKHRFGGPQHVVNCL